MSFFGFGQQLDIDIQLDGMENRKVVEIKCEEGKKEKYFLFYDGESVSGKVCLSPRKPGSRFEHQGIKIEFIGQIELYYDRGNHHEFSSLVKELARPGDIMQKVFYDFEFNQVEKPYESYTGSNVRLRYFLRVTVVRRISDIVREMELLVHTLSSYPEMNNSIKMEVGIEDCLHIEFEYNKSKYHLKDVIVGKIYFLLVRIKIKHMEIAIIKRETTGSGPNTINENETIAKYEIMDGAPVKGENIPIRVFLAGYDLTPTMRDINKKFSVRYFLNLVLVDEEDRRYFKQQEITLWRKGERVRRPIHQQLITQQLALQQIALKNEHVNNAQTKDTAKTENHSEPSHTKPAQQPAVQSETTTPSTENAVFPESTPEIRDETKSNDRLKQPKQTSGPDTSQTTAPPPAILEEPVPVKDTPTPASLISDRKPDVETHPPKAPSANAKPPPVNSVPQMILADSPPPLPSQDQANDILEETAQEKLASLDLDDEDLSQRDGPAELCDSNEKESPKSDISDDVVIH